MKVEEKSGYVLITSEETNFTPFFVNFEEKHSELQKKHLIIQLSDNLTIVEEKFSLFLEYAEEHQQNGTTFVVVTKDIDVNNFPETFNVVPTLQEAEDLLELENIQRDLGF